MNSITEKIKSWNYFSIFKKLVQLLLYIGIVSSIIWWQQKDMLSIGDNLKDKQIALLDIHGVTQTFQLNNGKANTLIYFFAPWCKICDLSIDNLEAIKQNQSNSTNIIAIALDWQSIEEVDRFLANHQLTMPILLGTREIQQRFKVNAFPSYYLLSESGEILSKSQGYSTEIGMRVKLMLNQ